MKEIERIMAQVRKDIVVSSPGMKAANRLVVAHYGLLLSWITKENNLDGLADD